MNERFLVIITHFGDSGFIGYLVLLTALYLTLSKSRKEALELVFAFIFAFLSIGILKILALDCSEFFSALNLYSPSGHAAVSTAVYGTIALIWTRKTEGRLRQLIWPLTLLLITGIAISRVLLGAHNATEVSIGLGIGALAAYIAHLCIPNEKHLIVDRRLMILVFFMIALIFHGIYQNAEDWMHDLAFYLRQHTNNCVF